MTTTTPNFPEDTATVFDPRGFPRTGHLTDHRYVEDGVALYYFPGDFIVGDGFEAYLDPTTASDPHLLAEALSPDLDGADLTGPIFTAEQLDIDPDRS